MKKFKKLCAGIAFFLAVLSCVTIICAFLVVYYDVRWTVALNRAAFLTSVVIVAIRIAAKFGKSSTDPLNHKNNFPFLVEKAKAFFSIFF